MFQQASNLKAISFAQCNTQRVENMNSMFKGCKQLTKLDMGNIDTHNVQAAAGFASLFDEMGSAVPEGCDLVLGEHFIIHTPENASGMFSNTNIRSITCTPELQQFLLKHTNIIGLKTITAAGPISWYNLYTGQLMNTTNELVITHELNHFVIPQLEGTITNARIMWGDNQEETYQKNANHTYSSVGEHHVTVQSQGADGVSLNSIKGIKKINFSKF